MKFLFLVLFSFSLLADTQRVELEVITETGDKHLALEKAVGEVSRDFVRKIVGEEKYNKHENKFEKKIVENKNRYIIFARTSLPQENEEGKYLTKVTIGLSEKNLQALLLEHNLFYNPGSSCILPAVSFELKKDKLQKSSWWLVSEDVFLASLSKTFYKTLSEKLINLGFYTENPFYSRFSQLLPSYAFPKRQSFSHFKKTSRFLNCDLVISGRVSIEKDFDQNNYFSSMNLKILNIKTKQNLFNFKKKFNFRDDFEQSLTPILKSLKHQLSFYKERGSLDLSRLWLSVQGPLNQHERELIKQALVRHIRPIQALKENLITSRYTLYEVESSKGIKAVVKAIKSKKQLGNFKLQVTGSSSKRLDIYARRQARQ